MNSGRYQKLRLLLSSRRVTLYVGAKTHAAYQSLLEAPSAPKRKAKLEQLSELSTAVYEHGVKKGRKEIIDKFEQIRASVNYLPPGRPKAKRKQSS